MDAAEIRIPPPSTGRGRGMPVWRVLLWIVAVLIATPIVLAGGALVFANTEPGQRAIETLTANVTGGEVRIDGLSGRFPDALRAKQVVLADDSGAWLTVTDAALDWSPRRLMAGVVAIDRLTARSIDVARLADSRGGGGVSLPPVRVELAQLRVARLNVVPVVAGRPIVLNLQGSGSVTGRDMGRADLTAIALEGPPDRYGLTAALNAADVDAALTVSEAPSGLLAGLAGLPDLGAVAIAASVKGPMTALASKAAISAGPLRAELDGSVNMVARAMNLTVNIAAPAMTPRPGVGWASVQLRGSVTGPFTSPRAAGTLSADNLTAEGVAAAAVRADVSGTADGDTELHGQIDGIRLPGPSPDLLSGGPVTVDATARLAAPGRPVRFTVSQTLFKIAGLLEGSAAGGQLQARLTVPELGLFAALGGIDLHGQTALDIDAARAGDTDSVAIKGSLGISGGAWPAPSLIGATGTIDLAASARDGDIMLSRFAFNGAAVDATASGQFAKGRVDGNWAVALADLSAMRPDLSGTVSANGQVAGPASELSVTADVTGDAAARGEHLEKVRAQVSLDGLPGAPSGRVTADGLLFGAPLSLAAGATHRQGGFQIAIDRADWKSLTAGGRVDLAADSVLPTGHVKVSMSRLADLAPLVGRPIAGSVTANLDGLSGTTRLSATVTGVAMPGTVSVGNARLDASVADRLGRPDVEAALTVDAIEASGVRGSGRLTARGPANAVALTLAAATPDLRGAPAQIQGAGVVDVSALLPATGHAGNTPVLSLASLQAAWRGETTRLLAPARISFGDGIAVDRFDLGLRQGKLSVSGRIGGGGLDVRANLADLPAGVIAIAAPGYDADGTIAGEARLTGSAARPAGTARLTASRVRLRNGNGRALPPADLTVAATLNGATARLDAKLAAGGSAITLAGAFPPYLSGPIDLRLGGAVDVALIDPLLQAQGIDARGRLDVALGFGGTVAKPRASGTVRLSGGDFQDYGLGTHISAIAATLGADGDTIRIERFGGTAGTGSVSAEGSVVLAEGFSGLPRLDLILRASNARLLGTDLATATADANLSLRSAASGAVTLGGTIRVGEADIQVPEKLPPSIAVLPVRVAGAPPPKPAPPSVVPDVALSLTLDAPAQVYVRGRGLDVELGGKVVFGGTAAHPLPVGGLRLRRGTFSVVGQTLQMTQGTIDFSGAGLTNPQLNLVATSVTAALTATLTISGDVRNPKIVLSSSPELPQDEILSQLLFNTSKSNLTAFQVAELASALASFSGIGSPLGDPLEKLRTSLGLDQLSVGSDASGGATLQAGRYIAKGVRIGATQSAAGGDTQATVQIDITKGLKLQTTAGAASSAETAVGATNGASVGLTYQFQY